MFSRIKDTKTEGSSSVVQRKTFEQIGMEQICDAIDELKDEVKGVREELRSFHSRFESWQDLNKIIENIQRRETELLRKENEFLKLTSSIDKELNLDLPNERNQDLCSEGQGQKDDGLE